MRSTSVAAIAVLALCIASAQVPDAVSEDSFLGDQPGSADSLTSAPTEDAIEGDPTELTSAPSEAPDAPQPVVPTVVRLLVPRPNPYGYQPRREDLWMAAAANTLVAHRLASEPAIHLIPSYRLAPKVDSYQDFGRRISKQQCLEAGRLLGATHIVYSEVEPRSDAAFALHVQVVPVGQGQEIRTSVDFSGNGMGDAADLISDRICAAARGGVLPENVDHLSAVNVRNVKLLGQCSAAAEGPSEQALSAAAACCSSLGTESDIGSAASFASVALLSEAQEFAQAARGAAVLAASTADAPYLHLLAGTLYREAGLGDEADRELRLASRAGGEPSEIAVERALLSERKGRMAEAIAQYRSALKENPGNVEAHVGLSALLWAQGSREAARESVPVLAALWQQSVSEILARIGLALAVRGSWAPAAEAYGEAYLLSPDSLTFGMACAQALEAASKPSEAAETFLHVARAGGVLFSENFIRSAHLFYDQGLESEAEAACLEFESLGLYDVRCTALLVRLAQGRGDCERLREMFSRLPRSVTDSLNAALAADSCLGDATPPRITLRGSNPYAIEAGGDYEELGATVVDETDGDLSADLVVQGHVNLMIPGTYRVLYAVADRAGNRAEATRMVVVGTARGAAEPTAGLHASRAPVRRILGLCTALVALGSAGGGLASNAAIGPTLEEYGRADNRGDAVRLHDELEQKLRLRNALYAIGSVFAAGFTLNLVLPSAK